MELKTDPGVIGYDVIGDVHGHVHALEGLLAEMGYVAVDGSWRHPDRKAIFIGDLIDRGTHQVETVRLVQAMVAAGDARMVVGNHEYNAVAWLTELADQRGEFARSHSEKNRRQHSEFLAQVGEGSALHHELVEWFCTLPLWLEVELGGSTLRLVHACWHDRSISELEPLLSTDHSLTPRAILETSRRGSPAYEALEVVLKGPEVDLGGLAYLDKDGNTRHKARVRWWDPDATSLERAAIIPAGARTSLGEPFPAHFDGEVPGDIPLYDGDVPVIVGHYWCSGTPEVYSPLVACVDYSVAARGPMVAYRWSGEQTLQADHYVVHDVHHPDPDDLGSEPGR